MDFYKLGSLFLDFSIGILVLGAVVRLILATSYRKRDGSKNLTDEQRKALRKVVLTFEVIALMTGVASLVLLLRC